MGDGRIQLLLVIALVYSAQGFLSDYLFSNPESPAKTAYLRSVAPNRLVVEVGRADDHDEENGHDLPAAHTPFFFQAIPINTADKEMLMTVKGIGPILAESILRFRQTHGPLHNIEDLAKIPGVGTKRAASLAPFLLLGDVP